MIKETNTLLLRLGLKPSVLMKLIVRVESGDPETSLKHRLQ